MRRIPRTREPIPLPIFPSGTKRDCPETIWMAIEKMCAHKPQAPENDVVRIIRRCRIYQELCNNDQTGCIEEQNLESQCNLEVSTRAKKRIADNFQSLPEIIVRIVSSAKASKPKADAFFASGGCPLEFDSFYTAEGPLRASETELIRRQAEIARDYQTVLSTDKVPPIIPEAAYESVRLSIASSTSVASINLFSSPTIFQGASFIQTPFSDQLNGLSFSWDRSTYRLGMTDITTISATRHWREPPRFNDFDGRLTEEYFQLPDGYRNCNSSFTLTEKAYVCTSSVKPTEKGMIVVAWMRGDAAPFSNHQGEFGFTASVDGISSNATACQAKMAGCTVPGHSTIPASGADCQNIRHDGNNCDVSQCVRGVLLCSDGKVEHGQCVTSSTYPCGACYNDDF